MPEASQGGFVDINSFLLASQAATGQNGGMQPKQPDKARTKPVAADMALDADDVAWVERYAAEVERAFGPQFKEASDRFKEGQVLLDRFGTAIQAVLENGRSVFPVVDEAHNELCIAGALLANKGPRFVRREYEPPLAGSAQTIDFRATGDDGLIAYIDVKTIKPMGKDRWDHYQQILARSLFPPNVQVVVKKEWLGGEIWHSAFAARDRMLEYTLEMESKVARAQLAGDKTLFILALCGEGFHWHEDRLEDFVSFYRSGAHRPDDPFAKMEAHDMSAKRISLKKNISRFACMRRAQFDITCNRLNWNVQSPPYPSF